jgi:hypothetical protein
MKSVGAWRFRDLVTDRLPADGLDDERKRRALPLCMEMTIGRSCVSAAHRSGGARDQLNAARQRRWRADPRGGSGEAAVGSPPPLLESVGANGTSNGRHRA